MMMQQMLQDAYEHRHSLHEAEDAFMLDGHTDTNVPLLQSKSVPTKSMFFFPFLVADG
jgi:hypothetical protein